MNCKDVREQIFDLVTPGATVDQNAARHVEECAACAAEVKSLRQTMALLDGWSAPEPSPYFDVRLQARLREEKTLQQRNDFGWLKAGWLHVRWQPVMAAALSFAIAAGVMVYQAVPPTVQVNDSAAVSDLQALDKNADVYNNFDLLYDDEPQQQQQQQQDRNP
ncbi:MAG TPA: hypothetical protein VK738_11405 [Terriglobales bacterium]|jgi:hypothetical protein|nr:hypothetical protein [Terriglobales bacterium]